MRDGAREGTGGGAVQWLVERATGGAHRREERLEVGKRASFFFFSHSIHSTLPFIRRRRGCPPASPYPPRRRAPARMAQARSPRTPWPAWWWRPGRGCCCEFVNWTREREVHPPFLYILYTHTSLRSLNSLALSRSLARSRLSHSTACARTPPHPSAPAAGGPASPTPGRPWTGRLK